MVTHHHQDGHPSFPGRLATINVCAHEDTIPSTTEEEESTSSMSKFEQGIMQDCRTKEH